MFAPRTRGTTRRMGKIRCERRRREFCSWRSTSRARRFEAWPCAPPAPLDAIVRHGVHGRVAKSAARVYPRASVAGNDAHAPSTDGVGCARANQRTRRDANTRPSVDPSPGRDARITDVETMERGVAFSMWCGEDGRLTRPSRRKSPSSRPGGCDADATSARRAGRERQGRRALTASLATRRRRRPGDGASNFFVDATRRARGSYGGADVANVFSSSSERVASSSRGSETRRRSSSIDDDVDDGDAHPSPERLKEARAHPPRSDGAQISRETPPGGPRRRTKRSATSLSTTSERTTARSRSRTLDARSFPSTQTSSPRPSGAAAGRRERERLLEHVFVRLSLVSSRRSGEHAHDGDEVSEANRSARPDRFARFCRFRFRTAPVASVAGTRERRARRRVERRGAERFATWPPRRAAAAETDWKAAGVGGAQTCPSNETCCRSKAR